MKYTMKALSLLLVGLLAFGTLAPSVLAAGKPAERVCPACGYRFPKGPLPNYCTNCGASIVLCRVCGYRFDGDIIPVYCTNCGAAVAAVRDTDDDRGQNADSAEGRQPDVPDPTAAPEATPLPEDETIVRDEDGGHEAYYKVVTPEDTRVSEGGMRYVNGQLLLTASLDATKADIETLAASLGGRVVGYIELTGNYQVELDGEYSLDALREIARRLQEEEPLVDLAEANLLAAVELDSTDTHRAGWTDEWLNHDNTLETAMTAEYQRGELNPVLPSGNNWWAEAVNLPYAWYFADRNDLFEIKVGIIDTDFDTSHRDLEFAPNGALFNLDAPSEGHGTHVAGLIAARHNDIDIRGAAPNAVLYGCMQIAEDSKMPDNLDHPNLDTDALGDKDTEAVQRANESYKDAFEIMYGVAVLLDRGVRVINMSLGFSSIACNAFYDQREGRDAANSISIHFLDWSARAFDSFLTRCDAVYPDFLIFKATGNENGKIYVNTDEKDPARGLTIQRKSIAEYEKGIFNHEFEIVIDGITADYDILGRIPADSAARRHIVMVGACSLDIEAVLDLADEGKNLLDDAHYSEAKFSIAGGDILAPGGWLNQTIRDGDGMREYKYEILSTVPYAEGETTGMKHGTSMAAPIAAGIAALVWGWQPELSCDRVKECILSQDHATNRLMALTRLPMVDALAAMKKADEVARQDGCYHDHAVPIHESGYLSGFAYTVDGNGSASLVRDCRITLTDDGGNEYGCEMEAGEDGFAMLLPPGDYVIRVESPSALASCTAEVTVEADRITCENFRLGQGIARSGYIVDVGGATWVNNDVGLAGKGISPFPLRMKVGEYLQKFACCGDKVYCCVRRPEGLPEYGNASYRLVCANFDGSKPKTIKTGCKTGDLVDFAIADGVLYYAVKGYDGDGISYSWRAIPLDTLKEEAVQSPPEAVEAMLTNPLGCYYRGGVRYEMSDPRSSERLRLTGYGSEGSVEIGSWPRESITMLAGVAAVPGDDDDCYLYYTAVEPVDEYEYETRLYRCRASTGESELLMTGGDSEFSFGFFNDDSVFYFPAG